MPRPSQAVKIFALTTRGLEAVSAEEIAALAGVTVDRIAYRRVAATCAGPLAALLSLRTVDDIFLDVATWPSIGHTHDTLDTLRALSARLDLREAIAACAGVRPVHQPPLFSVTANFVGRRNYNTDEIKQACAESIAARHRWRYSPDDGAADLNVRLFIEHETAFVGVRLGKRPLHDRPYKQAHVPGSLKPPIAAALLALAGVAPGSGVLDPCCGAGTILIEAALQGAQAIGGDNDPAALQAAQTNASAAGAAIALQCWDAQALPLADETVERIVSNLPWGRVVEVDTALAAFYRRACAEMQRVVAPGGRIALLTDAPHLVILDGLECKGQIDISLFGQTPVITLFRK
jgi:tRNA (guanine6-N2)-methyltransferase